MRIVTDGKHYAVAKGRWFWTEMLSINLNWWSAAVELDENPHWFWVNTIEEAEDRIKRKIDADRAEEIVIPKTKYWDVK